MGGAMQLVKGPLNEGGGGVLGGRPMIRYLV